MPIVQIQYLLKRDVLEELQIIPMWTTTWEEPQVMDAIAYISMALRVAINYAAWQVGVHLGDIGMVEDDSNDKMAINEESKDDETYQVNNLIHDVPPEEGEEVGGLVILSIATLALGKMLTQLCNFY